jgi:hypothetical protein
MKTMEPLAHSMSPTQRTSRIYHDKQNSIQNLVLIAAFSSHVHKKNNIYKEVEKPAHLGGGANVVGRFHFKLCPPRVTGVDGDGLEDT